MSHPGNATEFPVRACMLPTEQLPSGNWSFLFPSNRNHRWSVGKWGEGSFPEIYEFPWFHMTLGMVFTSHTTRGWQLPFPGPSNGAFPVRRAFWLTDAPFFTLSLWAEQREPTQTCKWGGWETGQQTHNESWSCYQSSLPLVRVFTTKLPTQTGMEMHFRDVT